MEVRQVTPAGRPVIERYGLGGFRIGGAIFTGPVLVLPSGAIAWMPGNPNSLKPDDFTTAIEHGGIEILLIGTGAKMRLVPAELRVALRQAGIGVDGMDTGAACRTYGVLAAEDRHVAAALLPIGTR